MTEQEEKSYQDGYKAALLDQLHSIYRGLAIYQDVTKEELITEREQAIAALRDLCEAYGDNEWPDNLHLYDIITKHLGGLQL